MSTWTSRRCTAKRFEQDSIHRHSNQKSNGLARRLHPVSNNLHGNVLTPEVHTKTIVEKKFKYSKLLTQIKVCYRPVVVQFSLQFFIFAVYINSFRVEVNGVVEIFLSVFLVTFILVNLCYCYNKPNENNVSSSVFFFPGFLKCKTAATITFFKTRWRHLLPPKWYHVI